MKNPQTPENMLESIKRILAHVAPEAELCPVKDYPDRFHISFNGRFKTDESQSEESRPYVQIDKSHSPWAHVTNLNISWWSCPKQRRNPALVVRDIVQHCQPVPVMEQELARYKNEKEHAQFETEQENEWRESLATQHIDLALTAFQLILADERLTRKHKKIAAIAARILDAADDKEEPDLIRMGRDALINQP